MNEVGRHLVKTLTVDETSNYHMTISSSGPCAAPPRASPHAGTEVWPPDALVPGVSPRQEGLGMVEPSRSDPIERLSNLAVTDPPFVGRRAEPTLPCLSFIEILQALQDRPSLEIEHTLITNLQDWTELHYWASLAHDQESIWSYCRAGDARGLAEVLVERSGISLAVTSVPLDTPVDLQPRCWSTHTISTYCTMRPLVIVAGKFSSQKGALP
jgi:hypothetical protein